MSSVVGSECIFNHNGKDRKCVIVAVDDNECAISFDESYHHDDFFIMDQDIAERFKRTHGRIVHSKIESFYGKNCMWTFSNLVKIQSTIRSDGCTCRKCKEYSKFSEPNQSDGTFICYGCRMYM